MSGKWPVTRLGSAVIFLSGGTPKKSVIENWVGDIPWVSSGEMTQRFIWDTEHHVSEQAAENGTRRIPENTVLVVVRGMSLAKEFRVALTRRDVTFNQDVKALVPNATVSAEFLFYYLLSQREAIRGAATEASHGTKKLELRVLEEWPLPVPSESEQAAVVEVIRAYDDLIENNRRRIQLLEESARLLYREWFVHLRFPGHEHVKVVDGVPEGWNKTTIGDLIRTVRKRQKIKTDEYLDDGPYPCVDQGQLLVGGYTDNEDAVIHEKLPLVVFGDHTRIVKYIDFPFAPGADGTQLLQPVDESLSSIFLYFLIREVDVSNYFYARHFKFLKASEAVIPNKRLTDEFTSSVSPFMDQIRVLRRMNQKLAQARDLLLPRLMNGEIAV